MNQYDEPVLVDPRSGRVIGYASDLRRGLQDASAEYELREGYAGLPGVPVYDAPRAGTEVVIATNPGNQAAVCLPALRPGDAGCLPQGPRAQQGQRPGYAAHAGPRPFDGSTYEDDGCTAGYARYMGPEFLLGDGESCETSPYARRRGVVVAGYYSSPKPMLAKRVDYNTIGLVGQMRANLAHVFANGAIDPTTYQMTPSSNVFTATTFSPFLSLGFAVTWGVGMLNYAPFNMVIETTNIVNADGASINRSMELFVNTNVNGGTLFVPFAQRNATAMNTGQAQVARLGSTATISITVPSVIAAGFSASVDSLTAFHQTTSKFAALIGAFAPAERH